MKRQNKLLLFFFVFTLAWTWIIGMVPFIFGLGGKPIGDIMFKFIAGPAPSIVGVILVLITYTKAAKKEYVRKMFSLKRMGWKWPLIVMAFWAVLSAMNIFVSTSFFGSVMPGFSGILQLVSQPWMIFVFLLFALISGPINEEFGWRGFALDKLFVRFGFWKGSIILGFVWAIWHLPWCFYPGNAQYIYVHSSPLNVIAYIAATITLSCMVSIVYVKTNRSALGGAFVHMISNFFTGSVLIYPFDNTYIFTCLYVSLFIEGIVIVGYALSKNFKAQVFDSIQQIKKDDVDFGMVNEVSLPVIESSQQV